MNLTSKRMLQFMTVCAGACALTATATTTWVSDSFEAAPGQGNTNGVAGMAIGTYKSGVSEDTHSTNYLWIAAAGDGSTLIAGSAADSGYAGIHPIVGANQALVLNLSTEGQTLSRAVTNGVLECNFASGPNVYVDTLIQFTPSEDTPTIATGTKVAVYVNVNSNLVVYHRSWNVDDGMYVTNSVFPTLGTIYPTNWYRLTIQMGNPVNIGNAACKISLNTISLTNSLTFTDDFTPGGPWFITGNADTTLSAIAFQGTGKVDELVVTDVVPDFGGSSAATLTLVFDTAKLFVTTSGVAIAASPAVVADPSTIEITSAPWYEIDQKGDLFTGGSTTNFFGTMITNIIGVVATSGGAVKTNEITAKLYSDTGSVATGLGASYPANKVALWATTKAGGVSPLTSDMLDEYLMNAALNTNPGLKINSIVHNGDNTTTITVGVTNETGVVDFTAINGTMKVKGADDLIVGFGDATAYPISVTNTTGMTIEVPAQGGQFLKAVVE